MDKHINLLGDSAIDRFDTVLQYFIDEYENCSRLADDVSFARSLLDFVRSDNIDYYNS